MKCLTICQPYAELIVAGEKPVENRTWATRYRGWLLIHAGISKRWLQTYYPLPERMEFGAIVGAARLLSCATIEQVHAAVDRAKAIHANLGASPSRGLLGSLADNPHVEGPICWILRDAWRFDRPIPYAGQQGLFDVPDELVAAANVRARGCPQCAEPARQETLLSHGR